MSIPHFLQTYLASYDLSKMDIQRDKDIIITEILNKGEGKALKWITKTYSKDEIKEIVSRPTQKKWKTDILRYWLLMFGLTFDKKKFERGLINVEIDELKNKRELGRNKKLPQLEH